MSSYPEVNSLDEPDYKKLIEKIIQDCEISEMHDDLNGISYQLEENRSLQDEHYRILMELINRVDDRLDKYMENQSTKPMKEVDELKKWLKEYFKSYVKITEKRIANHEKALQKHNAEIFGNGKVGLRTEIESLKTKAAITLKLVIVLLTGGGLSGAGFLLWQFIIGG
jgi:uncharacterized protein YdcH (DUF465 family)